MITYMEFEHEPIWNEKADEEVGRQSLRPEEDEERREGVSRDGGGKPWREVLKERLGHSPVLDMLDE